MDNLKFITLDKTGFILEVQNGNNFQCLLEITQKSILILVNQKWITVNVHINNSHKTMKGVSGPRFRSDRSLFILHKLRHMLL